MILARDAIKCVIWLLVLLVSFPLAPAHAQGVRVSEIEIRGNQRINREYIMTVVTTKVGDEASPERVERDRVAIEALGFFSSVVAQIQRSGNTARVVFVVVENPVVKQVEITGSTLFTTDQILAAMKTKPTPEGMAQVFNRANWEADLAAVDKLYSDRGYLIRRVDNVSPNDPGYQDFVNSGIVRLEIHELKVGKVILKWPNREIKDKKGNVLRSVENHKTKSYVVLRELAQRSGALYNDRQIGEDYRRLSGLGYFETVTPNRTQGEELDTVDITWELTEKRTGQISVGAGYSPREHLLGRAELADQNFQGKGRSLSLSGEMGSFGGDGAPSVEFQFYEPWLTKDRTSLTVNLYDKLVYRFAQDIQTSNVNNDQYYERRLGGQLSFGRPFRWPITLGLRYDDVHTNLSSHADFPQQSGQVIAGNIRRQWNTRDYVNYPTRGSYISATNEVGHATLDESNADSFTTSIFNKVILDTRRYYRLKGLKAVKEPEREQESQKVPVLAMRFMAGTIVGDVPFFEQLFLGGAETLRGYREDRFWGKTMYLASVEYRRPIMNRITGVLFADAGDAFGSQSEFQFHRASLREEFRQHSGIEINPAIGVGLRVATPIGPIRLDYGYGLEGGRVSFSIGQTF